LNFVLSITELDWTMRGVAPWYNVDSVSGRQARRGPPSRTGGLGMMFVTANFILLLIQLCQLGTIQDRAQKLLIVNATLLTVLTAFMPRSHELRYWMFLPLLWVPVNLSYLRQLDPRGRFAPPFLLGLVGLGIALTVLSPKSGMLDRVFPSRAALLADVPAEVRDALAKTGRYCDPTTPSTLFMYSFAVTGLPSLLSNRSADCPNGHGG
jgi:hypothetical protein